jgi:outer membrane protein assembly factor BamB
METFPPGASLSLQEKEVAVSPNLIFCLPGQTTLLSIRYPGFKPLDISFSIHENVNKKFQFQILGSSYNLPADSLIPSLEAGHIKIELAQTPPWKKKLDSMERCFFASAGSDLLVVATGKDANYQISTKVMALEMDSGKTKWEFQASGFSCGGIFEYKSERVKRFYFSAGKVLYCLDLSSSQPQVAWSFSLDRNISGISRSISKGIFAVYDDNGNVYTILADEGKIAKKYSTNSSILGDPVIENNIIYFGCKDGRVFAMSPDKEILWRKNYDTPLGCPPTAHGDFVYVGTEDGKFYCLDTNKDGSVIWEFPAQGEVGKIVGTPIVIQNQVIFQSQEDKKISLYGILKNKGSKLWVEKAAFPSESQWISIKNSFVLMGVQETFYLWNSSEGSLSLFWKVKLDSVIAGSPFAFEDPSKKRFLVIGTENGTIYCFSY